MTSSDRPLLRSPWGTFKYLVLSPAFAACVVVVGLALGAGVASSLAVNDLKKKETPPPMPVTKTATITASPSEKPSESVPAETSQAPVPPAPQPARPAPVPTRTVTQRPVAPAPAPAPVNRRASTTLTGSCNGTLTIYASGPNASISLGGRRGGSSLSLPWNGSFAATLTADGSVSGSWNCGN
ncbi:MAG: hypothetical protein E6049_09395 [Varibaculum cambriense]|nr:hypothetical protein [Varibaculum cambriense]